MRERGIRGGAVLVVVLASLVVSSLARAGGFSNLDFGTRRMGMFAVVARPDDPTAIYHNPAGLTLSDGTVLYTHQSVILADLAFQFYDSKGQLRPDHSLAPDWNVGIAPFFAVTSDLGLEDLRLGFALYAPNAYGASLPKDEPTRYNATSALFLASRATLAAAYEVTDWFSVGAGVSLVHVYLSASRVMNPLVLSDPDQRFEAAAEAYDADLTLDGQGFTWAWDVGVLFHPLESLRIGASFSSGSGVDLEGDLSLKWPDGKKDRAHHTTGMVIPFTLRAGLNWEFAPNFEVGVDIVWWHYQVFQTQRSKLSEPLMGLEELVDPKNYDNGLLWCIGLLYRVIPTVEVMVGYQKDDSPIPSSTFTLENPTRDSHAVSLGARWQVTENVRIGLAMLRVWFVLVDVQDSRTIPPNNAKGHGGMTFFGADVAWRL